MVKVLSVAQFASFLGRLASQGSVVHSIVEKGTNVDVILVTECKTCKTHKVWVAHNKGVKPEPVLDRAIGTWQVSNGWELYTVS